MALRNGMRSIVIIHITYNNSYYYYIYLLLIYLLNYLLIYLLTYLLTATELSLGGSSPYTSTDKTNRNRKVMLLTEQKLYILAVRYMKL